MSLSKTLWDNNLNLAQASLDGAFVRGLADGSLPRETFAYYVGQDAFFLEAFARAYSVSAAKSPNWETFQTLHKLADGVLDELNLHAGYAAEWNVNLKTISPGTATRQYTDFLLATAWSQPIAVTLVAMSPCMRLYAWLGQQLKAEQDSKQTYTNWIETYADPEFESLAVLLETLVDEHAISSPLIQSTYEYAMVCERDFFAAAYNQFVR